MNVSMRPLIALAGGTVGALAIGLGAAGMSGGSGAQAQVPSPTATGTAAPAPTAPVTGTGIMSNDDGSFTWALPAAGLGLIVAGAGIAMTIAGRKSG